MLAEGGAHVTSYMRCCPGMVLRVGILARASKIQKIFAAFGRNHRGAESHSIQCLSGTKGGRVHVASYMLVLHRSGQGVLYVPRPPCLQV
jgi:hypothetical protein